MSQRQREDEELEIAGRGLDAIKAEKAALAEIKYNQEQVQREQHASLRTMGELDRAWIKRWKLGRLVKCDDHGLRMGKIISIGSSFITVEDLKTGGIMSWYRWDTVSYATDVEAVVYRLSDGGNNHG